MPEQFVKIPEFGIALAGNDCAMFFRRDRPLFPEPDRRPLPSMQNGPGQPAHIQAEIVKAAEVDVGGDRAPADCFEQKLGRGLNDHLGPERSQGRVLKHGLPANLVGRPFGFDQGQNRVPPGPQVTAGSVPAR